MVDGNQNYYIDSTTPLARSKPPPMALAAGEMEESITYTIDFADDTVGLVAWTETTVYDTIINQGNPNEDYAETIL